MNGAVNVAHATTTTKSPKRSSFPEECSSFTVESSLLNIPRPIVFPREQLVQFAANFDSGNSTMNGNTSSNMDPSQIPFIRNLPGLLAPSASYGASANSLQSPFPMNGHHQQYLNYSVLTSQQETLNRMIALQDLAARTSAFRPIPKISTASDTNDDKRNSNFEESSASVTTSNVAPVDYSTKNKTVGQRKRFISNSSDDLVLEAVKKFFVPHSKSDKTTVNDNFSDLSASSDISSKDAWSGGDPSKCRGFFQNNNVQSVCKKV